MCEEGREESEAECARLGICNSDIRNSVRVQLDLPQDWRRSASMRQSSVRPASHALSLGVSLIPLSRFSDGRRRREPILQAVEEDSRRSQWKLKQPLVQLSRKCLYLDQPGTVPVDAVRHHKRVHEPVEYIKTARSASTWSASG